MLFRVLLFFFFMAMAKIEAQAISPLTRQSFMLPRAEQGKQNQKVGPQNEEEFRSCVRRIHLAFVSYPLFAKAMSLYYVPQSQWVAVTNNFKRQLYGLERDLERTARSQKVNPLHPYDGAKMVELLHSQLEQRFIQALFQSNFTNKGAAQAMFRYIFDNQPEELKACFRAPVQEKKDGLKLKVEETQEEPLSGRF